MTVSVEKIWSLKKTRKSFNNGILAIRKEPSIVTIKLHPHKQGTSAELSHTNIPDDDYEDIVEGWKDAYFGAIIDFYLVE